MQMIFIFRFDLLLGQSTCSSLPQFCLQMGGTCAAYIILQSSMQTSGHLEFFNSSFYLQILVLSSCGHFISLTAGQYFALMVQHEHSTTLWQRYVFAEFFTLILKLQFLGHPILLDVVLTA